MVLSVSFSKILSLTDTCKMRGNTVKNSIEFIIERENSILKNIQNLW